MEIVSIIAAAVAGLALGWIAAWLSRGHENARLATIVADRERELAESRGRAEEQRSIAAAETAKAARVPELEEALARARNEVKNLTGELSAAETRASEQASAAAQQIETLSQVRGSMLSEFKVMAAETLKVHADAVSKQSTEQISTVLTPLREKITEFQTNLQSVHTESVKERATLTEQVRALTNTSARMTLETENLTRALKGDVKTQGVWGEMMLTTILERSGLRKDEEYVIQESHPSEDGGLLRPDAIVNLPLEHCLVVDAKVSLTAYERFVNSGSEDERSLHLAQHAASIRSHIERLAAKEYWRIQGSQVDYVIMFVPIEPALGAALQHDPGLTTLAVQRGVAIATPTTLMIALRTVANVWAVERQNRNAQEIAVRAGRLYDKFVGFIDDMQSLGGRLDAAKDCHAAAMGKLSTGQGNLVRQVELLREMGATTKKALPQEMIGDEPITALTAPTEYQ